MLLHQTKTLLTGALITAFCGCATAQEPKSHPKSMPTHAPAGSGEVAGFAPPTSPMPISAFIVSIPPKTFKTAKNKDVQIDPQLLFIDEENAKKAFEQKEELQKLIAEVVQKTKADFKSAGGKFSLKGEIMAKLNEKGFNAEGVLFNAIRF